MSLLLRNTVVISCIVNLIAYYEIGNESFCAVVFGVTLCQKFHDCNIVLKAKFIRGVERHNGCAVGRPGGIRHRLRKSFFVGVGTRKQNCRNLRAGSRVIADNFVKLVHYCFSEVVLHAVGRKFHCIIGMSDGHAFTVGNNFVGAHKLFDGKVNYRVTCAEVFVRTQAVPIGKQTFFGKGFALTFRRSIAVLRFDFRCVYGTFDDVAFFVQHVVLVVQSVVTLHNAVNRYVGCFAESVCAYFTGSHCLFDCKYVCRQTTVFVAADILVSLDSDNAAGTAAHLRTDTGQIDVDFAFADGDLCNNFGTVRLQVGIIGGLVFAGSKNCRKTHRQQNQAKHCFCKFVFHILSLKIDCRCSHIFVKVCSGKRTFLVIQQTVLRFVPPRVKKTVAYLTQTNRRTHRCFCYYTANS